MLATADRGGARCRWAGGVLTYTNTGERKMPSWDGYGDWNVAWTEWQAGGIVTGSR
jgi:hypothetical protein